MGGSLAHMSPPEERDGGAFRIFSLMEPVAEDVDGAIFGRSLENPITWVDHSRAHQSRSGRCVCSNATYKYVPSYCSTV